MDWTAVLPCVAGKNGRDFIRVPEELMHLWQKACPQLVEVREERGQWEYLYKQEELATLAGNRFHKKRNHFNSYVKAYGEPDYRGVTDAMVEDVLGVQDDWCQWHECEGSPSLLAENEAINRVLTRYVTIFDPRTFLIDSVWFPVTYTATCFWALMFDTQQTKGSRTNIILIIYIIILIA